MATTIAARAPLRHAAFGVRSARRAASRERRRARRRRLVLWATLAVTLVALWPARLGGTTSFVAVHGRSMEPTYHSRDLLLVRGSGEPAVGEVVVYRTSDRVASGANVVHRVVAVRDDGRLVTQGDANEFPDHETPSRAEVVGAPIVNLGPWPLRVLAYTPLAAALALCIAVGWLIWPPRER